jgi:hypothetical protein
MKKIKFLTVTILFIFFSSLLFVGCGVSQDEFDKVTAEKTALQDQFNSAVTAKNDLQDQLDSAVADKNVLQAELDEINAIYPPGEFASVGDLESWVTKNRQPATTYLDETFRSALVVQELGLADGYLISVMYDEDDTDPGTGWIFNAALVNGRFYVWNPETGDVHDWYSDLLVK